MKNLVRYVCSYWCNAWKCVQSISVHHNLINCHNIHIDQRLNLYLPFFGALAIILQMSFCLFVLKTTTKCLWFDDIKQLFNKCLVCFSSVQRLVLIYSLDFNQRFNWNIYKRSQYSCSSISNRGFFSFEIWDEEECEMIFL